MKSGLKTLAVVVVLLLTVLAAGCAGLQLQPDVDISPAQFAAIANEVYISQFRSHQTETARTDLTKEERRILNIKLIVLTELRPLLDIYNVYILTGEIPDKKVEDKIIQLTTRLTKLLIKAVIK